MLFCQQWLLKIVKLLPDLDTPYRVPRVAAAGGPLPTLLPNVDGTPRGGGGPLMEGGTGGGPRFCT